MRYGLTRGLTTLIGVGAAGFLVWLATRIGDDSAGEYWATLGIIAGAGIVMAVSQLLGGWTKFGRPRISPHVLVLGFLPAAIVVGWIAVAAQPDSNLAQRNVLDYSGEIGIGGLVGDLTGVLGVLAFGLGLVFGYAFDTTGARRRDEVVEPEARIAEEPLAAERGHLAASRPVPVAPTTAAPPTVTVGAPQAGDGGDSREFEMREGGTPVAPQPAPTRGRRFLRRH